MSPSWKYVYARICIVLLFSIVTMLQVISFPSQFAHMRNKGDIQLWFEIMLTVTLFFWFLTAQFALFQLWKIIAHMSAQTFYTAPSLQRLNKLVTSFKLAVIVSITLLVTISVQADDPGIVVMLTAITLFLSTLFIAASLLRDQIQTQSEKIEVK